jgi:biopolymer transport protein ExbD
MAIRPREESHFSVELTPMIDVVFLLIIFFLVATTFQRLEREIAVSVPVAETGQEGDEGLEPVVVNVLPEGEGYRIVVGGNAVTLEQLRILLARRVASEPGTKALVRADGSLRHQQVVEVADACRKARASISFGTLEKLEKTVSR